MELDYYQILQVSPDADLGTIKRAYRNRAFQCHPDRGGSHQAMLEINEAFEILSDPIKRNHYDQVRARSADEATRQTANAEANRARQDAPNYPHDWAGFESWLDGLTKDFANAKYGKDGVMPTVEGSTSGGIFMGIGALVGLIPTIHSCS